MGIMDDVTGALSRGTSAAERAARSTKLKADLRDVNKRRQNLAAQLGASLYEATRENAELRQGREELYRGIASCDQERDKINRTLMELQEAAAEEAARQSFTCSVCGAPVRGGDLFCSGCGTPADRARLVPAPQPAPAATRMCASCGAPLQDDFLFCMECGTPVPASPAPVVSPLTAEVNAEGASGQDGQFEQPVPGGQVLQDGAVGQVLQDEAVAQVSQPDRPGQLDPGSQSSPFMQPDQPVQPVQSVQPEAEIGTNTGPEPKPKAELEPAVEAAPPAAPVCPQCGASFKEGQTFCMDCGARLASAE